MSKLDEIMGRTVYMTRNHDPKQYTFGMISQALRAKHMIEQGNTQAAQQALENIQKTSARQLIANEYPDWKPMVKEAYESEGMEDIDLEDKSWAQMIAYMSLYEIDRTNLWHLANIIAISNVMESKL